MGAIESGEAGREGGNPYEHVTVLIERAASGDGSASADLLPLVYSELRRLAQSNMVREGGGPAQTLQPTALVHEAFLRLLGPEHARAGSWENRGHFFGAAAVAMRRILIERARARNADKRGGGRGKVELSEDAVAAASHGRNDGAQSAERSEELIALDSALERLEKLDERAAKVVMLRYFTGLTIEQTAAALELSPATVKKSWVFARAWLNRQMSLGEE
ncbi:MAG: ECF-type sigma factor [Planctomycetota bacterium]